MELNISLNLGSTKSGLTLNAQFVNISGINDGSAISSNFAEIGGGHYYWRYTVADDYNGGIKFVEESAPSSVLTFMAVDRIPADIISIGGLSTSSSGIMNANVVSISGVLVNIDSGSVADSAELSTLGDLLIRNARIIRLLP